MSTTDRDRHRDRGRTLEVSPEASLPELADWMERLWDQECPAKLEIIQLHGRQGITLGAVVDRKDYKPNQPKPSKEDFIKLSNQFVGAAQRECDVLRKPMNYIVGASNQAKSSEPYARFPIALQPKTIYLNAANGKSLHGSDFDPDGDGEEGEKRLGTDALLARMVKIFDDDQWRQQHFSESIGGMFKLFQEENQRLRQENAELRAMWRAAVNDAEAAKSAQADRDLARDKQKFWLNQMADGATLVKGLLPSTINRLVGQEIIPNARSSESLTLEVFIKSLSDKQIEVLFGRYDEASGEVIQQGIFTMRQAYIIDGVANSKLKVEELDRLISGQDEVTMEQIAAAQQHLSEAQITPAVAAIMEWKSKRSKSN